MDTLSDDQFEHLIRRARGRGVAAEVCQQRLIEAFWYLPLWWETPELCSTAFMIVAWAICGREAEYRDEWDRNRLRQRLARRGIRSVLAEGQTWRDIEQLLLIRLEYVKEQYEREQETAEQRRARRANAGLPLTASTVQQFGRFQWWDEDGLSIVPDGLPEYRDRSPQEQPGDRSERQEEADRRIKELDRLSEHCRTERERYVLALARIAARGEDIGDALRGQGVTDRWLAWLMGDLRRRASDAAIRSPVRRSALYITGRQASAHT